MRDRLPGFCEVVELFDASGDGVGEALLFASAAWMLARSTSRPVLVLVPLLCFVLASLPVPWIHWTETRDLTKRRETHVLIASSREYQRSIHVPCGYFKAGEAAYSLFTRAFVEAAGDLGIEASFSELLEETTMIMEDVLDSIGHEQDPVVRGQEAGSGLAEFLRVD